MTDHTPERFDHRHGCGRDNCAAKRQVDTGELYWAQLVCGHGDWPCGQCRYPTHAVGPCPGVPGNMPPQRLEEIRGRCLAAPSPPWKVMLFPSGTVCIDLGRGRGYFHIEGPRGDHGLSEGEYAALRINAARLIARGRMDLPDLVEALEASRAREAEQRELLHRLLSDGENYRNGVQLGYDGEEAVRALLAKVAT